MQPAIRIYCCNVSWKFRYLDFLEVLFFKRGKRPLNPMLITASRQIRTLPDLIANEQISFSTSMHCAPVGHTACFPTKTPTPNCSALKQRLTQSRKSFVRSRRPQTVQTNHLSSSRKHSVLQHSASNSRPSKALAYLWRLVVPKISTRIQSPKKQSQS